MDYNPNMSHFIGLTDALAERFLAPGLLPLYNWNCDSQVHPGHNYCEIFKPMFESFFTARRHNRHLLALLRDGDHEQGWNNFRDTFRLRANTPRPNVSSQASLNYIGVETTVQAMIASVSSSCRTHLARAGMCQGDVGPEQMCSELADPAEAYCHWHMSESLKCMFCENPPKVLHLYGLACVMPRAHVCAEHRQRMEGEVAVLQARCTAVKDEFARVIDQVRDYIVRIDDDGLAIKPVKPIAVDAVAHELKSLPANVTNSNAAANMCPICYADLFATEVAPDTTVEPSRESKLHDEQGDELDLQEKVVSLHVCAHIFHASCLEQWLQTRADGSSTCPSCRRDVLENSS